MNLSHLNHLFIATPPPHSFTNMVKASISNSGILVFRLTNNICKATFTKRFGANLFRNCMGFETPLPAMQMRLNKSKLVEQVTGSYFLLNTKNYKAAVFEPDTVSTYGKYMKRDSANLNPHHLLNCHSSSKSFTKVQDPDLSHLFVKISFKIGS